MEAVTWYVMPAVAVLAYIPILRNFVASKRGDPAGEARWTLAFCVGLNGALLPCALVEYAFKRHAPDVAISGAGIALVLARLIVFARAKRALGENYSVELRRDTAALVRSGPYAIVRHPVYVARLAGTLGLGLVLNAYVVLCVFGTLDLAAVMLRIRAEERLLMERFGSEYETYRSRAGALTPFRALMTLAAALGSRTKEGASDAHK